jgi:hypothetical protein
MNKRKIINCVRFLLPLLGFALAAPAWAGIPGSVIVFPKFIMGTVIVDGITTPATEIAIRAVCPADTNCDEDQQIRVKAEWVCPGLQRPGLQSSEIDPVCKGTSFKFSIAINGTVTLNPDNVPIPGGDPIAVRAPECPRGFLIAYVIDENGSPIKFDGLGGVATLRENGSAVSGYTASLINAAADTQDTHMASGDPMILGPDGALTFDGIQGHYQALTSGVGGQLRFTRTTGPVPPDGYPTAFITLLTLDVRSNHPNHPTFVPLDFFSETGRQVSTSTKFLCWTEQRVEALDSRLTFEGMGRSRQGLVVSGPAEKAALLGISDDAAPASLMGLIEIAEGPVPGSAMRQYINTFTFNSPPLATTRFVPTAR